MNRMAPVLWWIRRDFRLSDNPALMAAVGRGGPVIPVVVHDPIDAALGAAPKWRMGLGLAELGAALDRAGSRLILRRGDALDCLRALLIETGARAVVWNRLYDEQARARDENVKKTLRNEGIATESFGGHLLFEPWTVATGQGGFYRVFTPFWNAVRGRDVPAPTSAPKLTAPDTWPQSETLQDWNLGAAMNRGAEVVARHVCVGEARAADRLARFVDEKIHDYKSLRDFPAMDATSRLSENLAWGEIGPRRIWAAGMRARDEGRPGAETFLKELVWREFAYHLLYHTPHIANRNWRPEWDAFPWRGDNPDARAWRRGMTGVPLVDAGMREMYVTGTMHNRVRMIAASYLTKHLMTHWKVGLDWFADCLIDWDPAANAMGWQWAAGSGPDAAPYFRVFNPETQAQKFDGSGEYRKKFILELAQTPGPEAADYFRAVPRGWGLGTQAAYPDPIVDLPTGRARALAAYGNRGATG
ncbi:MAG: deoxyribodipyrimidine photo-lyase [Rhodobacteraceae bacterium]|nr:deoxyribodipyrimidine photo-lyase [Paracoccaceae bacterium]